MGVSTLLILLLILLVNRLKVVVRNEISSWSKIAEIVKKYLKKDMFG